MSRTSTAGKSVTSSASKHFSKLLGALAILIGIFVGLPALVVYAAWISLAPADPVWWVAVIAGVLCLWFASVSERRVCSDVSEEARAAAVGAGAAQVGATLSGLKSAVLVMAVRGGMSRGADMFDRLSAGLTALFAVTAAGLAPHWAWAYGFGLGGVAAWTMIRRAGAWRGVDLKAGQLTAGREVLAAIVGLAVGAAWFVAVRIYLGSAEWEPAVAAALIAGALTLGVTATTVRRKVDREKRQYAGPVARVIGISDAQLETYPWEVKGGFIEVRGNLSGNALTTLEKLEAGCVLDLADWMPLEASSARIMLGPATDDVRLARAISAETEGLVVSIEHPDAPYAISTPAITITMEDLR